MEAGAVAALRRRKLSHAPCRLAQPEEEKLRWIR
jgi:hypothetical protein